MKIVFFGDSITDAGKCEDYYNYSYGHGFLGFIAGELLYEDPYGYEILNRGICGNRIVDLYARLQPAVWNEKPDVLSILVGVNDIYHEVKRGTGVPLKRFEKVYRAMIEETVERFPDIKIILCEPFILKGTSTEPFFEQLKEIYEYAKVVKNLAEEYGLFFLPLQEKLDQKAEEFSPECWLWDGVHPTRAGAKLIADEWLKLFKNSVSV